jgi:soluble lytic murein transglycosylase
VGELAAAQQVLMDQEMEPLQRVRAAYEFGLTSVAARAATTMLFGGPTRPEEAPQDLLRLAYPIDYVASLNRETFLENVDPLFMAALIRTESYWDTRAVSIAFAYGLTQVIEPTGQAIADSLGVEGWTTRDLFKPAISIRFGANYIGSQLRRFDSPYAALAAYNAGPGNAERWTAATIGQTPADFVEAVDFSETRHYIEIVMSSYAFYRLAHR